MTLSSAKKMNLQHKDFYSKNDKIYVATDCIIFGFDDGDDYSPFFKSDVPLGKYTYNMHFLCFNFVELGVRDNSFMPLSFQ